MKMIALYRQDSFSKVVLLEPAEKVELLLEKAQHGDKLCNLEVEHGISTSTLMMQLDSELQQRRYTKV